VPLRRTAPSCRNNSSRCCAPSSARRRSRGQTRHPDKWSGLSRVSST